MPAIDAVFLLSFVRQLWSAVTATALPVILIAIPYRFHGSVFGFRAAVERGFSQLCVLPACTLSSLTLPR
jgi:hypothetical protein